jgi:hypothetical protein
LRRIRLPPEIVLPLRNLLQFVKQEDAFALGFADWLHDPDTALLLEFFNEERVVSGQAVGCRVKSITKINFQIIPLNLRLCVVELALFFVLFLLSLQVFDH